MNFVSKMRVLLVLLTIVGFIQGLNSLPLLNSLVEDKCNKEHSECLIKDGQSNKLLCDLCNLVVPSAKDLVNRGEIRFLLDIASFGCNAVLGISDIKVCKQLINLFEVGIRLSVISVNVLIFTIKIISKIG